MPWISMTTSWRQLVSILTEYKKVFLYSIFCLSNVVWSSFFPPPSRSTDEGVSTHAQSYCHVCNIGVLPVLCTVPWTSNNGQSQALPAKRSHDCLQLRASGTVDIHRL